MLPPLILFRTNITVMEHKFETDSLGLNSSRNLRQAISLRSTCRARSLTTNSWPLWTRLDRVASAWDRMNDSSTWKHTLLVMFLPLSYSWHSHVIHMKFQPQDRSCIDGYITKGDWKCRSTCWLFPHIQFILLLLTKALSLSKQLFRELHTGHLHV